MTGDRLIVDQLPGAKRCRLIEKCRLVALLALGGTAEIYLARRPGASGVSKFLAIKRILPGFSDNEAFANMFIAEAKICRAYGAAVVVMLPPRVIGVGTSAAGFVPTTRRSSSVVDSTWPRTVTGSDPPSCSSSPEPVPVLA